MHLRSSHYHWSIKLVDFLPHKSKFYKIIFGIESKTGPDSLANLAINTYIAQKSSYLIIC
jgi:hypothetical protein